jgi:hypothetical protein
VAVGGLDADSDDDDGIGPLPQQRHKQTLGSSDNGIGVEGVGSYDTLGGGFVSGTSASTSSSMAVPSSSSSASSSVNVNVREEWMLDPGKDRPAGEI